MLTITIHVHERPDELERLLISLNTNPFLHDCPILIINNAHNQHAVNAVTQVAQTQAPKASWLIAQPEWEQLRSEQFSGFDYDTQIWLEHLRLGQAGWAVHAARMVGMLATQVLFPQATRVLHLDSDIILPNDLKLQPQMLPTFTCLQISGCPDLGRLEWIDLLLAWILGPNDAEKQNKNYVNLLLADKPSETIRQILGQYTELMEPSAVHMTHGGDLILRHEYHGACYVLSPALYGCSSFPEWYDNDWSFFSIVREGAAPVTFLPQQVIHAASRKLVLCQRSMLLEEHGNILHRAIVSGATREACRDVLDYRRSEIQRIKDDFHRARSDLALNLTDDILQKLVYILTALDQFLKNYKIDTAEDALVRFDAQQTHWKHIFREIGQHCLDSPPEHTGQVRQLGCQMITDIQW